MRMRFISTLNLKPAAVCMKEQDRKPRLTFGFGIELQIRQAADAGLHVERQLAIRMQVKAANNGVLKRRHTPTTPTHAVA